MGKKLTNEEFLEKLWEKNEHYRSGEFEVVSEYKCLEKVIIIKNKYGECKIIAETLLFKNSNASIVIALDKTQYFKNELLELNTHYKDGKFEVIGVYEGSKGKIAVLTPYGECCVFIASLVMGYNVGIESAKNPESYFLKELSFQNKHIHSQIIKMDGFKNLKTKCKLLTKYGWVNVMPMELKRLKNFNILSAISKTNFYINRCKDIRKDFNSIDYSQVNYLNNSVKIDLTCKIHNYKYKQKTESHVKGVQGCPYCMKQTLMYNDSNIQTHKEFIKQIEGILYILKLSSEKESFYKVGIVSKHRFEYRMNQLRKNYSLDIEYTENNNMVDAYNKEQNFLKEFKYYKYTPDIRFKGHTECLSVNPLDAYGYWDEERGELYKN